MLNNLSKWLLFYLLSALAVFLFYLIIPRNSLEVFDQPRGEAIHISKVSLGKDGFILVTTFNDPLQPEGTFLGSSDLLPAGTYRDINVPLQEGTASLDRVLVVLYGDNGDGSLSSDPLAPDNSITNLPLRSLNGAIVKKLVKIY